MGRSRRGALGVYVVPMARSYRDLSEMSDEALIVEYDSSAPSTMIGLDFIRDELHRRQMQAASDRMESMTKTIKWLTLFVAVLTSVSMVTSIVVLIRH